MRRSGRTHRAAVLGIMGAVGSMLAGCAGHAAWDDHAGAFSSGGKGGASGAARGGLHESDRSRLVFESPEVARANADRLPFERFEFSRNDDRVNPVRSVPLLASRQWPQPPRPAERRIRFSDWQQR